jgi:hypothetical protein
VVRMGEIKVKVNDRVEMDFRKTALAAYGYSKGALSKAAEQALASWTLGNKSKPLKARVRLPKLDFTVGDKIVDKILEEIEQEVI